jgi:hypothetical protein
MRPGARTALFLLSAIAALGACSDSTTEAGPRQLPRRIEIGDTVVERIPGVDEAGKSVHSFIPASSGWVALRVTAERGKFYMSVADSTEWGRTYLARYDATERAGTYSMPRLEVEAGHVYTVTVATVIEDSASFRYVIFPMSTATESTFPRIAIGDVVEREALDSLADIDEFTFDGRKGDELIVYAQARAPAGTPGTVLVSVTQPDTLQWQVTASAAPGDSDPESHATGVFTLPVDGTYHLTVTGDPGPYYEQRQPYIGPYRIEVARINRAPEQQPADIGFADTVSGTIERVGDIDEFHFHTDAAAQFNVFFEAVPGGAAHTLRLELPGVPDAEAHAVDALSSASIPLTENPSGSFTAAAASTYTVRVSGKHDDGEESLDRGDYRFFVYRVDPRPEHMSVSTLALGDTMTDEIDLPGDVDELAVTIPTPSLVNMELWRGAPSATIAPTARLLTASGATVLMQELKPDDAPESGSGTGPVSVPAGSYTLRIKEIGTRFKPYRGPYHVILHPIDPAPETRSATIVPGDTVEEESEPIGDTDRYHMSVKRGEHYDVHFQAATAMWMRVSPDTFPPLSGFGTVSGPLEGHSLMESPHTNRIDALKDGEFTISVWPMESGRDLSQHGAYRFVVTPYSAEVEHHAATIAPGDTIDDERLDVPGDIDEFTLTGTPGEEVTILFAASPTTPWLTLQTFDLDTKEVLIEGQSYTERQGTTRFRIPASGRIGVRLMEVKGPDGYESVGPYSMYVLPINRAPEKAAASFAIGDIVEGEAIEFSGDVDEFTFTGAAADRLRAFLELPHGDWGYYMGLTLEVSPAGSDSVLGSVTFANPDPTLSVGTDVITLPSSGSYTVRVRAAEERTGGTVPSEYRFQVRREP